MAKKKTLPELGALDAVLALYRAAQRLQAKAFAAHAFAWLGTHVTFEQGVIVTTFEEHTGWVDAHFAGPHDPRALMASHAKVRHLDVLSPRMLANPRVVHRQDGDAPEIAGARFAPLREHLLEFGGWYSMCIAIPSAEHHTTSVMMVCRNEKSSRFSDTEVVVMQALSPHFAEAAAVNRAIWLPRSAGPGGLPVAVIDAEGRFVQTTGAFVRLFWPHAPPATAFLGDDALRALHKRQPWPLPSGKHMLYGRADETGGFRLRIRSVSPFDQLSPRERQVATLFARGESSKAIAKRLGLAPTTARNHLQNLYAKLGVSQRSELLALVSRA